MKKSAEKGSFASNQGKILEQTVISTLSRKGFETLMYREWDKNREKYGNELLLKNVPYTNIYNQDGYTEFLLKSEKYNLEIRIECKWQQSAGSVDEKFPYLYFNCIEAMPEEDIIIILDGNGARPGAVEWLKRVVKDKAYTTPQSAQKNIRIVSLVEFIGWANTTFR